MGDEDSFRKRLCEEIERQGISRATFAQEVGISKAYVTSLCKGDRNPSNLMVEKIAKLLNINKEWLETGKGERFAQKIEDLNMEEIEIIKEFRKVHPSKRKSIYKLILVLIKASGEFLE